jgi:hypothetical protein
MVGHPQGASGAAGISSVLFAFKENLIPPTLNLEHPDPECDLDYVPCTPRNAPVRYALRTASDSDPRIRRSFWAAGTSRMKFDRRSNQTEIMDDFNQPESEFDSAYHELEIVNRRLGGVRAIERFLPQPSKSSDLLMLDVGAGGCGRGGSAAGKEILQGRGSGSQLARLKARQQVLACGRRRSGSSFRRQELRCGNGFAFLSSPFRR